MRLPLIKIAIIGFLIGSLYGIAQAERASLDLTYLLNGTARWDLSTAGDLTGSATTGGNVIIRPAGKGLQVKEGSNARMATCTLTAGACTLSNTSVTASTRIFCTSNADGGIPGFIRISARSAGVSATVTSSSGTDTSTVACILVEPAP